MNFFQNFYMQKRGQVSYIMIIEIVLLAFITAAFFYYHKDVQEDKLFEKAYAVRDMALLLETSQAVPGDIEIYYSQPHFDIGEYNYLLKDNLLRIYEGKNYLYSVNYPFFLDNQLNQIIKDERYERPAAFIISKEKGNLQIKEHNVISETLGHDKKLSCPSVSSTKKYNKNSIVVVAEDSRLAKIETYFINNPKIEFSKRNKDINAITEKTDFVLLLDTQAGETITVLIPIYDNQQSEKIGCLIANSLLENLPQAELLTIIKTSDEPLNINKEGLAVRIIIGENLFTDSSALSIISSAIKDGMEEYYNE